MNVQSVSENNSSFIINYTYNYAMSGYYKNENSDTIWYLIAEPIINSNTNTLFLNPEPVISYLNNYPIFIAIEFSGKKKDGNKHNIVTLTIAMVIVAVVVVVVVVAIVVVISIIYV